MSSHDFIHLNSMEELADWNPESSLQHAPNVSNTPLCLRPSAVSNSSDPTGNLITRFLVCHDFKGGYHLSEASQGQFPFIDPIYTTEYLQYVSTFIYFSHKRVTIPPSSWINLMHRNGVKVLGTFIVENREGSSEIGRIFEKGSEGEFLFATQLARVVETYGFDGWLMNFESSFPAGKFSPYQLQKFLRELKGATEALVPRSEIIWYDALTILNQVHWQNGLTLLNVPFFAATDAIFTNYQWREPHLHNSMVMSQVLSRSSDVYAGIDCFGRGSFGDGGFGVGTALEEIRKRGLSAALFAPGWTFEEFDGKNFHSIDKQFWVGDGASSTKPGPISDYTKLRESGSEYYIYTNFNRGFGKALWLKGEKVLDMPWVHIGAQSLLPAFHSKNGDVLKWDYTDRVAYMGGWSLVISATLPQTSSRGGYPEFSCPLYTVGIKVTQDLILKFTYQLPTSTGETIGFYCDIVTDWQSVGEQKTRYRYDLAESIPTEESEGWITAYTPLVEDIADKSERRIVEVGVFYKAPIATPHTGRTPIDPYPGLGVPICVATLGEILLTTLDTERENRPSFISSVIPTSLGEGKLKLSWSVYTTHGSDIIKTKREHGMWSKVTKDFAWFVLWRRGEFVGISHCLEFVVDGVVGEVDGWRVDGVSWEGAIFAGP